MIVIIQVLPKVRSNFQNLVSSLGTLYMYINSTNSGVRFFIYSVPLVRCIVQPKLYPQFRSDFSIISSLYL